MAVSVDESEWRWLVREGHAALREFTSSTADRSDKHWQPWQQRLLDEQIGFRRRAADRFPDTERWLWTDLSLQQASDWHSASYKASLLPSDIRVIDACCGAGADSVALAQQHELTAIDRDRRMLELTRSNLVAHQQACHLYQAELPG